MTEFDLEMDIEEKLDIESNGRLFEKAIIARGFYFEKSAAALWRGPNGAVIEDWFVRDMNRGFTYERAQGALEAIDRGAKTVTSADEFDHDIDDYGLAVSY